MTTQNQISDNNKLAVLPQGELILQDIDTKIDIETLQHLIDNYPRNSYGVFFNRFFETDNFVFIMNGKWYFFNEYQNAKQLGKDIIETWCWKKDISEIINSFDGDFEELEGFNNGWEYSSCDDFPPETSEYIFEQFTPDSPMIQKEAPVFSDLNIKTFFISKIKKILENQDLDNNSKAEILYQQMISEKFNK